MTAVAPPNTASAPAHACAGGVGVPPCGWSTSTKAASPRQVSTARTPRGGTDRLTYPNLAQQETEDELSHQQCLHYRQLTVVQSRRLKDERPECSRPAE